MANQKSIAQRILESVVGLVIIVAAFWLKHEGTLSNEWILFGLVGLGGFFVSKSLVSDFFKTVLDKLRA